LIPAVNKLGTMGHPCRLRGAQHQVLPDIAYGAMASYALSEGGWIDLPAMRTRARAERDGWVLNAPMLDHPTAAVHRYTVLR